MYATLYHAFLDLFGVSIPIFKIVMMFGFFVALAFLAASWVMTLDMKRYEKEGVIRSFEKEIEKPNAAWEYISNGIIGFIFGFKIIHLLLNADTLGNDPQSFLMSTDGSLVLGVVLALVFVGAKYFQLKKEPPFVEGALAPN